MLPAAARLTHRDDFATAIRRGRRSGRSRLVVHLLTMPETGPDAERPDPGRHATRPGVPASRAGFVVSKAVGNAVVRHRVSRRLRHLVAARLDSLPPGSRLVVRALPPAADASSADLGEDLDAGLHSALRRGSRR